MGSPDLLSRRDFMKLTGAGLLGLFLPDLGLRPARAEGAMNVFVESRLGTVTHEDLNSIESLTLSYKPPESLTLSAMLSADANSQLEDTFVRVGIDPETYRVSPYEKGVFWTAAPQESADARKTIKHITTGLREIGPKSPAGFAIHNLTTNDLPFSQTVLINSMLLKDPALCIHTHGGRVRAVPIRPRDTFRLAHVNIYGNGIIKVYELNEEEGTLWYYYSSVGTEGFRRIPGSLKEYAPQNRYPWKDPMETAARKSSEVPMAVAGGGEVIRYPFAGPGTRDIAVWNRESARFDWVCTTDALPPYTDPVSSNNILTIAGRVILVETYTRHPHLTIINPKTQETRIVGLNNSVAGNRSIYDTVQLLTKPSEVLEQDPSIILAFEGEKFTLIPWITLGFGGNDVSVIENTDEQAFFIPAPPEFILPQNQKVIS